MSLTKLKKKEKEGNGIAVQVTVPIRIRVSVAVSYKILCANSIPERMPAQVGLGLGAWCVVAPLQTKLNVHTVLDILAQARMDRLGLGIAFGF